MRARSGASCTISLDELQADLGAWMASYNTERPHSGKYCYGKTPMQTFVESAQLARDKQRDRTMPNFDQVAHAA